MLATQHLASKLLWPKGRWLEFFQDNSMYMGVNVQILQSNSGQALGGCAWVCTGLYLFGQKSPVISPLIQTTGANRPGLGKTVFSVNDQTLHLHVALTFTIHFSNALLCLFSLNYRAIMNTGYHKINMRKAHVQKLVYLYKASCDLAEGTCSNDYPQWQETTGNTERHNIETFHPGPFRLT